MTEQNFTFEHAPSSGLKFERFFNFLDECQTYGKDPMEYAKEKGIDIKNEYSETIKKIVNPKYRNNWSVDRFEMISKIDAKLNPKCRGSEGCIYNQGNATRGTCNTGLCTRRILKEIEKLENIK